MAAVTRAAAIEVTITDPKKKSIPAQGPKFLGGK
jgi:hypothetical protein